MAWRFDAATDRVVVPSGWTGSVATILLWFRRETDRGAGSNPWRAWSNAAGGGSTVAGIGSDGGGDNIVTFDSAFANLAGPPMDGTWRALALVMNGTAWALHHGTDPNSLTKVTGTRANATSPGSWTLSDNPDFLSGDIAAVKLFQRALSDAEVAAELATYSQVSSTNLLFRGTLKTSSLTPETGTTMTAGATAVTVVDGPPALETITGVLSASLPKPVAALTGTVTDQGQLAVTLQRPVANIAATVTDQGQLAAVLPRPVAALAGVVRIAGQLQATLPTPIANIAGIHPAVGQLAAVLPLPVADIHDAGPVFAVPLYAGAPELEPAWTVGEPGVDPPWCVGEPELIG